MIRLGFPKSQLKSPMNPVIRIVSLIDCDGSECGNAVFEDDGNLNDLPPHFYLIESELEAGSRVYGIDGELPHEIEN